MAVYDYVRKNDLLLSLGLLELANATDFAANAWNVTPPPTISVIFMVLGGSTALLILAFACKDLPRTWRNIVLLRQERRSLRWRQAQLVAGPDEVSEGGLTERDILVYSDLNTRELGNEVVDRLAMGLALGFGAFTVGIGTYLAIAGADPRAFLASNILTGYLGNVPAAMYGLSNTAWCVYGWRRAQAHSNAAEVIIPSDSTWTKQVDIVELLRMREGRVKTHAIINGWSGILGGAGSLVTASAYIHPRAVWGYLILIPCIISAVFANLMWRYRINYDRRITQPEALNASELLSEVGYAALGERLVLQYCHSIRKPRVPWPWRRDCQDRPTSKEKLPAFLSAYAELTAQHLKAARDNITQPIEEAAGGETITSAHDMVSRHELQTMDQRVNIAELHTAKLAGPCVRHNDKVTTRDLTLGLIALLEDLGVLPSLLARLANNAATARALGRDHRPAAELSSAGIKAFKHRLMECGDDGAEDVQRTCLEVLMSEGRQAASSRTRYLLELVGCYFQERTA